MLSQTKKSEMQVIAGCLRGLGGYLTNFEQDMTGGMLVACVQCDCTVHACSCNEVPKQYRVYMFPDILSFPLCPGVYRITSC